MFLPSVLTILVSGLAFFWHNSPILEPYSLQFISILVVLFILINTKLNNQNITNSIIIVFICLSLILSTDGLNSPLFFILDFVLFSLSLLLFPGLGLTLGLALVIMFLLNTVQIDNHSLANLISLLLMAPVAKFIGTQYKSLLTAKKQISDLSNQSEQLKTTLSQEENATLLWLSLNFYNKMNQALDIVSQMMSNLSQLPYHQKNKLNTLYQDLKELFKSGQELREKVEKINEEN